MIDYGIYKCWLYLPFIKMTETTAWAEDFNYDMACLLWAWHVKMYPPTERYEAGATFSWKKTHNNMKLMKHDEHLLSRQTASLYTALLLNASGCERGSTGPAWGPLLSCIAQWKPLTVRSSTHASCNVNRRERSRRTGGSHVGSSCNVCSLFAHVFLQSSEKAFVRHWYC